MPTVITTPGAADANSYISVAEFDLYVTTRPHVPSVVSTATQVQKEAAIIAATRIIDSHVCFLGSAVTGTQALMWPRHGMLSRTGFTILTTVIPQELKTATAELAVLLLMGDRSLDLAPVAQGLKGLKAGPISLDFKDKIDVNVVTAFVKALLVKSWLCPDPEPVTVMLEVT